MWGSFQREGRYTLGFSCTRYVVRSFAFGCRRCIIPGSIIASAGNGACLSLESGTGGRGAGRTHLLLTLIIWPLTTHPVRDEAPFLLLIETPPTFGRLLRWSIYQVPGTKNYIRDFLLILPTPQQVGRTVTGPSPAGRPHSLGFC